MKLSYIRKNFTKKFVDITLDYSELEFIRSCGLYAIPYTRESILIWNEHYGFAEEILEGKKNPALNPYRKKSSLVKR